jgi:hypothetical protein
MFALSLNSETYNTLWNKVGIPSRGLALISAISKGLSYGVFARIAELHILKKKCSPKACQSLLQPFIAMLKQVNLLLTKVMIYIVLLMCCLQPLPYLRRTKMKLMLGSSRILRGLGRKNHLICYLPV